MPEDFLEDLAADIATCEAAGASQGAGLGAQVGGTANLEALSIKGMSVRKQLASIVRNKFRDNVGVLAEWKRRRTSSARHAASRRMSRRSRLRRSAPFRNAPPSRDGPRCGAAFFSAAR